MAQTNLTNVNGVYARVNRFQQNGNIAEFYTVGITISDRGEAFELMLFVDSDNWERFKETLADVLKEVEAPHEAR